MSTRGMRRGAVGLLRASATLLLAAAAAAAEHVESPVYQSMGIFDPASLGTTDGRQIFQRICQGCHMPDAQGAVGAGHYPALANNPALASRHFVAQTVLMGRRNMPAFGAKHAIGFGGPPATLTDEQIAAVVNYVRTHFGNNYSDPVTAEEVRALDLAPP